MPWNDSTKIMTAPLNINSSGDIQQAVKYSSGDIGDCIINGDINKWAKWKPERNSKIGSLTISDRENNYFGLKITPCGPHGTISTFVSGFEDEWEYLRPRGLVTYNERFRFYDFLNTTISNSGYNRNAKPFYNAYDMTLPTSYIVGNGDTGARFRYGLTPSSQLPTGSILLSDMKIGELDSTTFSSMYFGLLFVYSDEYKLITSTSTISANAYGSELTIPESNGSLSGLTTGTTYTVYPCLSKTAHSSLSLFDNLDVIIALPTSPFTFKPRWISALQSLGIINPKAIMKLRGRLNYQFTVAMGATGGASTSITDAYYELYTASYSEDTSGTKFSEGSVGPLDIVTHTTQTIDETIISTNPGYVRIYVYRGTQTSVSAETWVKVTKEEDEPLVPID